MTDLIVFSICGQLFNMLRDHLYCQEVKSECDIVFGCPNNNDIKMLICLCRKMLYNAYFETFSRKNVSKPWTQCFILFFTYLYCLWFYALKGRILFLSLRMIWWVLTFVLNLDIVLLRMQCKKKYIFLNILQDNTI